MNRYFECCLYFTANELSRRMDKMAEKAFEGVDLTPIQGFTLLLIADKGMNSPGEIAQELAMNPSSITRFVDALVKKGYVNRIREGRTATLMVTEAGRECIQSISKCWDNIYKQYVPILSEQFAIELNESIVKANRLIEKSEE